MEQFDIPILLFFFTRLETTKRTFEKIREQKPKKLYLGCDGGRNEREKIKTEEVKNWVLEHIDWPCEVTKLFYEANMGTKYGLAGHIKNFFAKEEMGIVLEDDCLPDSTFFPYCRELLIKYKDDLRVFSITGNNFVSNKMSKEYSYYFSDFNQNWGFASWANRLKDYDVEMSDWQEVSKNKSFKDHFTHKEVYTYFRKMFERTYNKKIQTWDFQLDYLRIKNNALTIVPIVNLVSNIGFGTEEATYCKKTVHKHANAELEQMQFPLKHPTTFLVDTEKLGKFVSFELKYKLLKSIKKRIKLLFNL